MEIYPNRKLLLSEMITIDNIFRDNNISLDTNMVMDASIVIESMDKPEKFSFNMDFLYEFVLREEKRLIKPAVTFCSSTNPVAVMVTGPLIFVSYSPSASKLLRLEFMFGESLPINYYRRYIQAFNQKIIQIAGNYDLPVFPICKSASRKQIGYFRYWVFKEYMTALYYPQDSMPRYHCKIEEYYRADNCGINLLLDRNKIVAVDGWMNVPDELKYTSDMRLLISEKE
jgi:hypothetical protein